MHPADRGRPRPGPDWADWLPWLQLLLSSTLAVLFVVTLEQTRLQARRLGQLRERVAELEKRPALEGGAIVAPQLRSLVERLQRLEARGEADAGGGADLEPLPEPAPPSPFSP